MFSAEEAAEFRYELKRLEWMEEAVWTQAEGDITAYLEGMALWMDDLDENGLN